MTRLRLHLIAGVLAVLATAAAAAADQPPADVRALIAEAVTQRMGEHVQVEVELVRVSDDAATVASATPIPGDRIGATARFVLALADGRKATAVARVSAVAGHLVTARDVDRDAALTADDVAWVEGPLDGQLIEALPTRDQVVGARARRALPRGEVLTAAVLRPADSVRANETVKLVIRRGSVEVSGPGRAISSGRVGATIRVLRPGSREPLRGRIVEPGVVEILR